MLRVQVVARSGKDIIKGVVEVSEDVNLQLCSTEKSPHQMYCSYYRGQVVPRTTTVDFASGAWTKPPPCAGRQ
ncbi:unnamed protein product [Sphagnum jensenii]|uniref:Uncharacterized protein n=1 Tax=Sphagnum jensenii TaxID=128206 RepID=A0ABP1A4F6_9BRYO